MPRHERYPLRSCRPKKKGAVKSRFLAEFALGRGTHYSCHMRIGRFRWLALLVVLALPTFGDLRANPSRDSKRLLDGQTVNLAPLFRWWTNRAGPRPLAAWMQVRGRIVGTNAWGWVIEGHVEHTSASAESGGGSGRVLLRHPPIEELVEFERLSAELKDLEAQRGAVAGSEHTAQNKDSAVAKEQSGYRKYGRRDPALAREARALKTSENQAKAELKPLDQQIAELKKKLSAFPNPEHYEVDCFALDTGQQYQGLPMFDHGAALR